MNRNGKPVKKKKVRLRPKKMKIEWTDPMKVAFEALKQGMVANAELCTFDFTGQKVAKTMNVPPTGSIDLALRVLSTFLSAVPIFCVFVLLLHCYCR